MKTLLTVVLFTASLTLAQTNCCIKPSAPESFAMFVNNKDFVASHENPEPFVLESPIGKKISFKTPDGKTGYAYEIKNPTPTTRYIFVFQEWWGLNDYVKRESEKLYDTLGNVNVIALDLYDGKIATTRDSAMKYMQSVTTERAEAIIKGALEYVGKKATIATVGWCFGGGWSIQASILAGKQSKACVAYYGMPEDNIEKLKKLKAPVLFIWPDQDKYITKEVITKFQENMKAVGKTLVVKQYSADHAFANPSNPKYRSELTRDAFGNAVSALRAGIK